MDVEDDEVEMVLHQGQEPLELHQGQEPLELDQEPLEMHQEPLELHQEPLELHQEPMELHQEPLGPVVVELPQARRTVPLLDTSFHTEVRLKQDVYFSVAEPEPPGAATFRAAPELEPIFVVVRSWEPEPNFLRRLRLQLHLLGKQKRKALFLCQT